MSHRSVLITRPLFLIGIERESSYQALPLFYGPVRAAEAVREQVGTGWPRRHRQGLREAYSRSGWSPPRWSEQAGQTLRAQRRREAA